MAFEPNAVEPLDHGENFIDIAGDPLRRRARLAGRPQIIDVLDERLRQPR